MAVLVSTATGNFTAAATWANTANFSDNETSGHVIGTSASTFTAMVPGAVTIDGFIIKVKDRAASPAGTFTCILRNLTTSSDAITVTINVADIPPPTVSLNCICWLRLKLGAPVALTAGNQYAYKMVCSNSGSQVTVWGNNAVLTNSTPSAGLVTTTTQAPVASDSLHICGEYISAGSNNTITVTMDQTASTAYGSGTSQTLCTFDINGKGVLSYGTAASTNYVLRCGGVLRVRSGGTLNIGTSGTPIPRSSTAVLEFVNTTDGEVGFYFDDNSTVDIYGESRTSGKNIDRCYLNTDEAAAQTVLGVDTDTGWLNGDTIRIAATGRTVSQSEVRTLSANAGASSLTVSAGTTHAHSGTAPTQAEVILLTRNVKIRSTSSTAQSYGLCLPIATVNISWAEFRYMSSAISGKTAALLCTTTTGAVNVSRCSFYDCEYKGIDVSGSTSNNYSITNCVAGGLNAGTNGIGFFTNVATTGTNWTVSENWVIGETGANGTGFTFNDLGGTITNNVAVGQSIGILFSESHAATTTYGTIDGNLAHTCNSGINFINIQNRMTFSNATAWRCNTYGFHFNSMNTMCVYDTLTAFGNTTSNLWLQSNTSMSYGNIYKNLTFNGEASFGTATGVTLQGATVNCVFQDCDFSSVTAHTSQDVGISAGSFPYVTQIFFNNCLFGAATEFGATTNLDPESSIRIQKRDNTNVNHKTIMRYGVLELDSSVFNTAAPSLKVTPNSASVKQPSAPMYEGIKCAVTSGSTITASVYVNKQSGYNGAQPRLIVRKNTPAGITADTVLDTMTVGTGSWEQLSGTTAAATDDAVLEFIVDCDGTGGFINVDDWQCT